MRSRAGHFAIEQTCIGCGACEHACPGTVDAIYKVPGDFLGRFAIVIEECIDCGLCLPTCPVSCIHDGRADGQSPSDGADRHQRIRERQRWAAARP